MQSPEHLQLNGQVRQLAQLVGELRRDLEAARGAMTAQSVWLHALISAVPNAHDAGRAAGARRGSAIHQLGANEIAIKVFRQVDEGLQKTVNEVGK